MRWNKFSWAISRGIVCLLVAASLEPALAIAADGQRFFFRDSHMGTEFRITCFAADGSRARHAADLAFTRVRELDERLSDYRADSELSLLTQRDSAAYGSGLDVSDDLWTVLGEAQSISRDSAGAFDVTVGPLTRLWRRSRRQRELPSDQRLAEARSDVGFKQLVLRPPRRVLLRHGPMRLDLGGIAKGFAADAALAVLRSEGIDRALVDAGGDLAIGGPPPNQPGWRVAVGPWGAGEEPWLVVELAHCGVATSGDASRFTEIGEQRYSHIIDPHTGSPRLERWSVTVIAGRGIDADALASACCVLGPSAGLPLCQRRQAAVVFVRKGNNGEVEVELGEQPRFPPFRRSSDGKRSLSP